MSRLQLALNVSDLDEAVSFYSAYFRTEPAKLRPGYANFAIADPPLKLVLFEGGEPGTINHLGVEVESTEEVVDAIARLREVGLAGEVEEDTTCCYAVQTKVWSAGPDGSQWETYVVHADSPVDGTADGCCAADSVGAEPACC